MIRAIETRYKQHRFRSRLEARWAVFFDALGIEWEYEAEGYDLGAAGWYLPDFWLPGAGFHAEVKPLGAIDEADRLKMAAFDANPPADSRGLIVLCGAPLWLAGQTWHESDNRRYQCTGHLVQRCGSRWTERRILDAVTAALSVRFEAP